MRRIGLYSLAVLLGLQPSVGPALWQTDGTPVCTAANGQARPTIVSDGAGGAIVAWDAGRRGALRAAEVAAVRHLRLGRGQPQNRPDLSRGHSQGGAPPTTPTDSPLGTPTRRLRRPLPWAQLLRRVIFLDALNCPRCHTAMVVLALISDPQVVRKILFRLALPADVPTPAPAVLADDTRFDGLDPGAPAARPPL